MSEVTKKPVLIIGAGVVGLTIAQVTGSLRLSRGWNSIQDLRAKRSFFGKKPGWGLTLHRSLNALEKTIGPHLTALLPQATVDPRVKDGEGSFLLLNGATCEPKYQVFPTKRFVRAGRRKLRTLLTSDLDIQYNKQLKSFKVVNEGTIIATFTDDTSVTGGLLIGADRDKSVVRSGLKMDGNELTPLPVNLIGAVRHFTPGQAAPIRELDPLLFFALNPETKSFLFYSVQECITDPDGRTSYDCLVGVSWLAKDPSQDIIPRTSSERITEMKKRAQGFSEPLLSMFMDIPDDNTTATDLRVADFPARSWGNLDGLVTLAGDSAHAMTMYRGEDANHGILDAALLVNQLKKIYAGEISQFGGLKVYEAEMVERTHTAVLRSRRAASDAHDWDAINDESPLIGVRFPPASAMQFLK